MRPGYALKRLEAAEGSRRWVLRDLDQGTVRRLSDADADLLQQLDGTHSAAELVALRRASGSGRPAPRASRGCSPTSATAACSSASTRREVPRASRRRPACCSPHVMLLPRAGEVIDAVYRARRPAARHAGGGRGGRRAGRRRGSARSRYLVAGRYGTPFVVGGQIGLGGLVFLLGRLAIVAVHELAHGLVLASYGRRVERAGFKLLLVFPYAFVDTSQAWLEPRRRRIAVSAAGPAADLAVGAVFALACLVAPAGSLRDVLFQLAFAGYVGACFNLNPFLDRDGYQILVDVLREPNLRQRAREQLVARRRRLARCSPATRRSAFALVARGGRVRGRDDAALPADAGGGRARRLARRGSRSAPSGSSCCVPAAVTLVAVRERARA